MTTRDDVISAYFDAFAAHGFGAATIDAVAQSSGIPPAELVGLVGDRWAALDALARELDLAALAAAAPTGPVRDRLFDVAMARFDASVPYRAALVALEAEARRRPALGLAGLATLPRTAALMLSAVGVNTIGPLGIVRTQAFAAMLADAGRTWLTDEEPDLSATMRRLDERLDLAERWLERLTPRGRAEDLNPQPLPPEPPLLLTEV